MAELSGAPDQAGRWGDNYAAVISNTYHRNRIRITMGLLRKTVGNLRGKRAYDFGCGEGVLMRELAKHGVICGGCDTSAELVSKAPEGTQIGSVECLERKRDDSLDIIVALNVLPYLTPDELSRFWIASRRALKPGGILLHTVPNRYGTSKNRDHFWTEDPYTYPAKLPDRGFTEVARAFTGYYPRLLKWHRLSQLTGWDRIAPKLGIWVRGGRVYHPWRLALVPMSWRAKRSTGYFSVGRRDDNPFHGVG